MSMNNAPHNIEISVVMLTFNRPERCNAAVKHAADALCGIKSEILVINNGAMPVVLPPDIDGTPCRVLTMPRNLGAEARNPGWQAARGAFLIVQDDDAYIDPALPGAMLTMFRANPALGAIAFDIHDGRRPEACLLPTVFHGCACGLRREALRKIGGYPCGFTYYGEEYDVAFRLYDAGFAVGYCHDAGKVYHARETAGRDINRIISLLVRNNIYLWCRFFPWRAAWQASRDTLQRYRLVAGKEGAQRGWRRGYRGLPAVLLRGLLHRQKLSKTTFEHVAMLDALRQTCRKMRAGGIRKTVVCGTGKFPSLWQQIIAQHGIQVMGWLDHNTCWENQHINGIPVVVATNRIPEPDTDSGILVGADATPENARWLEQITAQGLLNRTFQMPPAMIQPKKISDQSCARIRIDPSDPP